MGSLVCAVCHKGVNIRKLLDHMIVVIVKRYTVMDSAGGNLYCKNDTVDIAGGMRFIGQLLLVLTLDKQAAVRVSSADGDGFLLCILFALFQFFPGSIVVLLLGQHRIMQLCGAALNLGRITDTLRHIQESIILDRNFRILPYARFQVGHLKQWKAVWRAK